MVRNTVRHDDDLQELFAIVEIHFPYSFSVVASKFQQPC